MDGCHGQRPLGTTGTVGPVARESDNGCSLGEKEKEKGRGTEEGGKGKGNAASKGLEREGTRGGNGGEV